MSAQLLNSFTKHIKYVEFDINNAEHLDAYQSLSRGKQHPSLRFLLEDPYLDVLTMMRAKLAHAYVVNFKNQQEPQSIGRVLRNVPKVSVAEISSVDNPFQRTVRAKNKE